MVRCPECRACGNGSTAGEEGEEANVQVEVQAYTDADIKTFRV